MNKAMYRQRTPIIWAEQFEINRSPKPTGVESYQKQVPVFDQFDSDTQTAYRIKTALGTYFELDHGDWILWNQDGVYSVMKDRDFQRAYVKVDSDG